MVNKKKLSKMKHLSLYQLKKKKKKKPEGINNIYSIQESSK